MTKESIESRDNLPEIKAEDIEGINTEGISFVTPLGESFSKIDIGYGEKDLSVLTAFPDRAKLKYIVKKSRNFKKYFPGTFNGVLLGNPEISVQGDNALSIKAQRLHYQTYFAAHELRKERPGELGENYCALSVCGIIYDDEKQCFYMSIRPEKSQEDAGKVDAPGGILNPDFKNADPFKTAKDRFKNKLGFDGLSPTSIGVERIFDDKYSLYNVVMFDRVHNEQPSVDRHKFVEIPLKDIGTYLHSDSLTAPARATILLALSQDEFKNSGWGREVIEKIMKHE